MLPPLRRRRDGWTADRQLAFLDALRAGATVADAARSAGMSRESAYRLRRNQRAASFIAAWTLLDRERAMQPSLDTLLADPDRFAANCAAAKRLLAERATRPNFDRFLIRRMNALGDRQPKRHPV